MKKKGGGDKLTLNNDFYEEVVQYRNTLGE
jgi:hypothetical protein